MEADSVYYQLKFQSVLEKFLENGYKIKDDIYFSRLLTYLEGKENKEYRDALINVPYISDWILRAIKLWELNNQVPDPYISSFTLKLLGIISEDEQLFEALSKHNVYNRAISLLKYKVNDQISFTVCIAHIKLLKCLLCHSAGMRLIIETSIWKKVLNEVLKPQISTIFLDKELKDLLTVFIEKVLSYNYEISSLIFNEITAPMLMASRKFLDNHNGWINLNEGNFELELHNSVNLLGDILNDIFEHSLSSEKDFSKLLSVIPVKEIQDIVKNLIVILDDKNLCFNLCRLYILLIFLNLTTGPAQNNVEETFWKPILALFWIFVEHNKTDTIIRSLNSVMNLWFRVIKVRNLKYSIENNDKILIEDQLTVCQSMPIVLFCHAFSKQEMGICELREQHITQILKRLSTDFIRFVYRWRVSLESEKDLLPYGNKTLSYIIELKEYYTRPTAILVFQNLVYSLMDVIQIVKTNSNYFSLFCRQETYIKQILESLAAFIEYFNISWQDSVESLCVLKAALEFIQAGTWTPRLVVADLNLVRVALMKYMSPTLALLIDQFTNSPLEKIGSILQNKLYDPEWIVRDSTIEAIAVVAEVSNEKFPSLRKIILGYDLCSLVFNIALNDQETFVRNSALNCLIKMVPVKSFWKKQLENLDVISRMLLFLKHENEGTARASAATLLTITYRHYGANPAILADVYNTMNDAVLKDLHWEVRHNALEFWNDRLEELLGNQGMIDGDFPKFTFSVENRKIVSLNNEEITKRLKLVLNKLCEIGCLTVLRYSLTDDSNIEVSKKALNILKKLIYLLEKYRIDKTDFSNEDNLNMPPTFCPLSPPMSTESSHSYSDDIIEQILRTSDTDLLNHIYSPDKEVPVNENSYSKVKKITCVEFIEFTKSDLDAHIKEREKWLDSLNSLGSLLNDILASYGPNDYNVMDCY